VAAVAAETEPEYVPQIEYVPASELRTGVIQPMPDMDPEELEAMRTDIAERGVQVPVDVIREVGYWLVVDGNNRAAIAAELAQKVPIRPVPGLMMSDAMSYALRVNVARRHLTSRQKRELIAAALRHDRTRSDAAIARLLGVSDKTVAAVRGKNLGISEVSKSAGGRPHKDGTPARRAERMPATPRQPGKDFREDPEPEVARINEAHFAPPEQVIVPETPVIPDQPPEPVEIELQVVRAERDDLRAWQAGAAETEAAFEATVAGLERKLAERDEQIARLEEELRTAEEVAADALAAAPPGPGPELTEALQVIEELRDSVATMTARYEAFAAADADRTESEPARGYRRLAVDMAHWLDVVHPDWQSAFRGRHEPDAGAPADANAHEDQHVQRRRWRRS
jgi:hypothetical protein